MDIRLLVQKDAEAYKRLRLEALQTDQEAFAATYEEEVDNPVELYEERFRSEYSFHYGAFINGELVGVVSLVQETKLKFKHRANIYAMYVSPSVRGQGVGKQLLTQAITKAEELEDVEQLYLAVVTENTSARHLYQSLGFEVFANDRHAMKIGNTYLDEVHMVKFL
ncbi:GNAT family N-acetyltransferase [Anaerobacillus alkaliphilus]|uniref:GNAT family N-acetyltransferase n=1 Tax=Anaerobacillus alkaliphilus TaxID=1548597 RepID=A0A4Q0VXV6_9BACI|nr:GNAT family N-acetyltransferase [Anaerobacillus alkaliphilus]RXJ04242.1 GNAT family N-acetyltransferase [Anaerobacillus alkaliphilus]